MCDHLRLLRVSDAYEPLGFKSADSLSRALLRGDIRRGVYKVGRQYRLDLREVLAGLSVTRDSP